MITPKELLTKSEKLFFKIVSLHLKGETIFPMVMPGNKKITGSNFSEMKSNVVPLYESSKAAKGKGYTIDWKNKIINGSEQSTPAKIYFETFEDYLFFIKKQKEYESIRSLKQLISTHLPALEEWINANPELILANAHNWNDIIKVCKYFLTNSPPHPYYIRELPIEVHTKLIELNTKLLKILLDILLPTASINLSANEFSERYYLKKIDVYTQIRILDEGLKPHVGYNECSLKLEDAAFINWVPDNVFIIENKVCFLTFPKVKNSVAIFGEGFKSRLTQHIPWLSITKLYCSFDLDNSGFEMLNMIRNYYPDAISFLMDEQTYYLFKNFSVENKSKNKILPNLNSSEQKMYEYLVLNSKRLEQEKISLQHVNKEIKRIVL